MGYPQISSPSYSAQIVEKLLAQILPPNVFFEGSLHKYLPHISWSPLVAEAPCQISFFLLCKLRENSFRYFYEMIRNWLLPRKPLNVLLQFAVDFTMPEISLENFMVGHLVVHIEERADMEYVEKHLPCLEMEIKRGILSPYEASRILERKGLTLNQKTALIQESISSLIKRRPENFDYDILSEMQRFLALCREDFTELRGFRHITKIISALYLFRKALTLSYEIFPERRYISMKLIRATLADKRKVLGIALAVSFLHADEVLEVQQIFHAVTAIIAEAQKVEGSFFCTPRQMGEIATFYLEIEKVDGFTLLEEKKLKDKLAAECKLRIQKKLTPIFMPQNEEVIMRHIVTLSQELKYVRDYPQVIIDFTRQESEKVEFLIIVLRVKKEKTLPLSYLFELKPTSLEYVFDRSKIVGTIRGKYQKEATLFYLSVPKERAIRCDQSVDLYKARREVTSELKRILGEFRDYNGGTLSKERELFHEMQKELGLSGENSFILENFFFSLTPPDRRSTMSGAILKKLFTMMQAAEKEGVGKEEIYQIHMAEERSNFYIVITSIDDSFAPLVSKKLEAQNALDITSAFLPGIEFPTLGMVCPHFSPEQIKQLWMDIEGALKQHVLQKKNPAFF